MAIVIKKRVDLAFLGEDYKEGYLIFKSIPINDYKEIIKNKDKSNETDALDYIIEILAKYFLSGKFPDENGQLADVKTENLGEFDGDVAIHCFDTLMGTKVDKDGNANIDPLSPKPSDSQSSTEPTPPTS